VFYKENQCNICTNGDLSAYLDGAISIQKMRQIAIHLKTCAKCRSEYEQLAQAKRLLHEYGAVTPPLDPQFFASALRTIRLSTPVSKLRARSIWAASGFRFATGVAACVSVLAVATVFVTPIRKDSDSPSAYAVDQIDIDSMVSAHANYTGDKQLCDPSNNRIIRSDMATSNVSQPIDLDKGDDTNSTADYGVSE